MHLCAEPNISHTVALLQRLLSQLPEQYDGRRTYDHALRAQMLYSLGSALSTETIDPFFTRWNKNPQTDEFTYPEAIRCLKIETCRPTSEKKRIYRSDSDVSRARARGRNRHGHDPQTPNLHA
ncbi:hypothetical protein EDB84DRAFT_876731 [Lactarius hengduanensis]|nr:hypothetical protein EDB84DRAFT_876731 [Lactarius hengduanensis]